LQAVGNKFVYIRIATFSFLTIRLTTQISGYASWS